jgi:hypothetical protein
MNCGAWRRRRRRRKRNNFQRLFSIKDDVNVIVIIYGTVTNITRKEGVIAYFNHLLRLTGKTVKNLSQDSH